MTTLIEHTVRAAQIVSGLALNPVLTSSALAFLAYGPPRLVDQLVDSGIFKRYVGLYGLKVALKVFLGFGVARHLNRLLNIRASNNWRFSGQDGWVWDKEIAVITGGCNGIGKATVLGLVKKGVKVAILDIADLPPDLAQLDTVFYWKCDITSSDAVKEAANSIREHPDLGHPSILINNAGVTMKYKAFIRDAEPEDISKIFKVNILSHWYTVKEFLPNMVDNNKGHIVTIASMASHVSMSSAVGYSSSKAAALSFHEGLASEIKNIYKAPGVITTIAHPMFVNTDMIRSKRGTTGKGRNILEPEEVADAITGQVFSCRGAQLFMPANTWWISATRGFPSWLQEAMRDAVAKMR
ncbi:hypothetical protein CkaCkLH20_07353 [Colletotrichum karsti]|uniref:Short-chain dehydrogenase/reductase 3 n=1 Tax=Colletotrichum karsti TaxID=1095194 RepID=A0A9P6LJZ1_9PEZI|nr:uncharacterized protein CkaCkLH20_07353 [Colletotrichum karsti]KAF9875087.1 hypothetical protein CkaCkLH20_07353 [Colletotrichum karsti]